MHRKTDLENFKGSSQALKTEKIVPVGANFYLKKIFPAQQIEENSYHLIYFKGTGWPDGLTYGWQIWLLMSWTK